MVKKTVLHKLNIPFFQKVFEQVLIIIIHHNIIQL